LDEHRYPEAEKLYREVLDVERRVLGPEHPHTTSSMDNLANVLLAEGHDVEAEKLYREALDIDRRVLGPECPDCASITYNLGSVAAHRGRRDEALSLLRDAVDHGLPPQADVDMDKDPDFKSLHTDPRFAALVAHAKERAAAAEKSK
jgi:non-specific serine/threonine protein kinase/serine/threonine-protein kinase